MSLFKARDWWASVLGEGEEFDQGCLCVGDVDNSGSGYGELQYLIHGSFKWLIRIRVRFPKASKSLANYFHKFCCYQHSSLIG